MFDDEADESTVFVCDLCHDNANLNYWLYCCADGDFGTHLECAISKLPVNKIRANPVVIVKTEEEPIKIQETNQEEETEVQRIK